MERVHSMFNNAFSTKAGGLVEKATAASLTAEDWTLNMEICDVVNSYDEGPKDAMKAIKRRLTNNKNQTQLLFTLTVLETCVKNCGSRFHILVTSKDFCNDVLLKLISVKNSPSLVLQNKVLAMIQEWAETFKSTAAMRGVVEVYEELKEKQWEFPQQDKASAAPILTPKRSVPQSQPRQQMHHPQQGQRVPTGARPTTGPITPSQEQVAKLRSELEIVSGNVQVMSEMLSELDPVRTDASDLDLLQELNRTCRAMQQRVVELIERVANEELTVELLKVNDDLNNVFLRYERFERFRTSQPAQTETPPVQSSLPTPLVYSSEPTEPPPSYSDTEHPTPEVSDLIDLGEAVAPVAVASPAAAASPAVQSQEPTVPSVTTDLAGLNMSQLMMTPSQPASYPNLSQDLAQFGSSAPTDANATEMSQTASEIEQWLQTGDPSKGASSSLPPQNGDTETSAVTDEFNAFLTERAAAGEQLPSLPDVPTTAVGQSNPPDARQRKMQTENQPMFGL